MSTDPRPATTLPQMKGMRVMAGLGKTNTERSSGPITNNKDIRLADRVVGTEQLR